MHFSYQQGARCLCGCGQEYEIIGGELYALPDGVAAPRGVERARKSGPSPKETPVPKVPLYVKSIESNIKPGSPGSPWKLDLGPKTLIWGPNGIGKSKVANAIELALTGRVSDIAGRASYAKTVELLTLAPGDESLFAKAQLSDETEATWKADRKANGGATKPAVDLPNTVDPEAVLPLRGLREAILGSPDTARAFFLGQVEGSVAANDVEQALPANRLEDYKLALQGLVDADKRSPAAQLLAVVKYAEKRARDIKADAASKQDLITSMANTTAMPTEAQVEQARAAVEEARRENQRRYKVQLQQEQTTFAQMAQRLSSQLAHVESQDTDPNGKARLLESLDVVVTETLGRGLENCPICESAVGSDHLMQAKKAIKTARYAHQSQVQAGAAGQQYLIDVGRPEPVAMTVAQLRQLTTQTIATAQKAEAGLQQYADVEIPEGYEPKNPQSAVDAVQAAQSLLEDLIRARERFSQLQEARTVVSTAEERAVKWKALATDGAQAARDLLNGAKDGFVARVQRFLPDDERYQFGLDLNDGDREVFRVGFRRDGHLYTALSGGEWAMLMAALACACAPASGLAVVIPEDRAFDAETLATVLRGLERGPAQIIMCSTVKPKGRDPKGWTVLNAEDLWKAESEDAGNESEDAGDESEDAGDDADPPTMTQTPAEA